MHQHPSRRASSSALCSPRKHLILDPASQVVVFTRLSALQLSCHSPHDEDAPSPGRLTPLQQHAAQCLHHGFHDLSITRNRNTPVSKHPKLNLLACVSRTAQGGSGSSSALSSSPSPSQSQSALAWELLKNPGRTLAAQLQAPPHHLSLASTPPQAPFGNQLQEQRGKLYLNMHSTTPRQMSLYTTLTCSRTQTPQSPHFTL